MASRKWVGVTMDTVVAGVREPRDRTVHSVQEKYLTAVTEVTGAVAVALPSFGDFGPTPAELCARLDGLLFTGAISNVHPTEYGQAAHPAAEPYDRRRDASTLALLRYAIDQQVPIFCICRGFQELNVACGGSLFARVHEVPGRQDHRRPQADDFETQYSAKHSLRVLPDSRLAQLLADPARGGEIPWPLLVNSLHLQGIDRLGAGLAVEATAEDGTVEAMRLVARPDGSPSGYGYAVQWHPEFLATRNPLSRLLLTDFAAALGA